MPNRWEAAGNTQAFFQYPTTLPFSCTSTCFTTGKDSWDSSSNTLTIQYTKMQASCLQSKVQIACLGFRNPVYKGEFPGFKITTWDTSNGDAPIDISEGLSLFSTTYAAHNMQEASDFTISPGSNVINTFSQWSFVSSLEFPLAPSCTINIIFPDDLTYSLPTPAVVGNGFFAPSSTKTYAPSQVGTLPNGKPGVQLQACFEDALSDPASGNLLISNIMTPGMVANSGLFYIEIYYGSIATPENLIASTVSGVLIPA